MKLQLMSKRSGKYLLLLCLGFAWYPCLAGETTRISAEPVPSTDELAWERWGNTALLEMANSQATWMRAALAAHLAISKDPDLATIGHGRFETIALLPTTDPLTLWHLAHYCSAFKQSSTCKEQHIIERLGEADPKNIAALLVVDQYRDGANWSDPNAVSTENEQLLETLAQAETFDEYWGRGTFQLLAGIKQYSLQYPPPAGTDLFKQFSVTPEFWVIAPILVNGLKPGFGKLFKLCEFHATAGSQAAIQRCLDIARTMQKNSKTFLARNMGAAIEDIVQTAARPDSAEALLAARKRAALRESGTCAIPLLQQGRGNVRPDETIIEDWTSAYFRDLDLLGEIKAARRTAEREYATYPDQFKINPADCPDVLGMTSSEMAAYLGVNDPVRIAQEDEVF